MSPKNSTAFTRHFEQVVDVRVLIVSMEKQKEKEGRQRAECNIHVKGNDLFAESAPVKICMRPWMNWWTNWIAKWFDTKIVLQDHQPHQPSTRRHRMKLNLSKLFAAKPPVNPGGFFMQNTTLLVLIK